MTMARASATRCCWPPESWRMRACARPVEPHHLERRADARARSRPSRSLAHAQAEGDIVEDGHVREERVALEHHADVAPIRRHGGDVAAVDHDAARARRSKPASMLSKVVLPQPDGPSRVRSSPCRIDKESSRTADDRVEALAHASMSSTAGDAAAFIRPPSMRIDREDAPQAEIAVREEHQERREDDEQRRDRGDGRVAYTRAHKCTSRPARVCVRCAVT